jgi:hypothetical protein
MPSFVQYQNNTGTTKYKIRTNITKKNSRLYHGDFFLIVEDPHGDHGLGSLVELRYKVPSGPSYSYITIHLIGTT